MISDLQVKENDSGITTKEMMKEITAIKSFIDSISDQVDLAITQEKVKALAAIKEAEGIINIINETADKQRAYKSGHKYDLDKFGLSEEKIRKDYAKIYDTFLAS